MEETKVDPEVLERALEIAEGDRSRLEITHDGAVIVHNNPIRGAGRRRQPGRG